ncbi:MAG: tRNA (guanosine(37)-N1)-methyltransferase TrmD [Pseudomonadota bacterium]
MWRADIITYLPETYPGLLDHSLLGKARANGLWSLSIHDLAEFGYGKHRQVDDRPIGGGAGMVLRADVAAKAIDKAQTDDIGKRPIVYLSPAGQRFDQNLAKSWSEENGIIFLCGRFEGIDGRVLQARAITEVSLGDFILCGGDVAAQAMIETTVRLLPGVVGDTQSLVRESFEEGLLEHPHFTRPRIWEELNVPDVLLSGNHADIEAWRLSEAKKRTKYRRSDLWEEYCRKHPRDRER